MEAVSAPSIPDTTKETHWLRRLIFAAIVLVILALAGLLGVSWYYSVQLLDVAPNPPSQLPRVLALHGSVVTLTRTDNSSRNMVDGLVWPGRRAILSTIISSDRTSVVRRITGSSRGLRVGMAVDLDDHVYASPADLHIRFRAIKVPDPLGPMPDWYVPGRRATWVIFVHGYKTNRAQGLALLPTLKQLGLPALLISYRNDTGAPASPDHLYHLGASEWQDVEAAVRYSLAHGAHSVILFGFSMGGNAVESFLHRSRYSPHVRAVVLDSPVLDWRPALDLAAANRHLPGFLTAVAERVIALRIGLRDLDTIDQINAAATLKTPTLIFHGTDDRTMPIGPSIALARARPDIVTLVRVPKADHTESWNVDPARYDARLRAFLMRVLR